MGSNGETADSLFPAWSCDSIGWHSGYCAHEFDYMRDMGERDGEGNVSCACHKCGEIFKAACGLDLPGRLVQLNIAKSISDVAKDGKGK